LDQKILQKKKKTRLVTLFRVPGAMFMLTHWWLVYHVETVSSISDSLVFSREER
jgi:hypothetical protein